MKKVTEDLFIKFFEEHHPEKLKYNPKIVEIVGNNVVFKMNEYKGSFCTNLSNFYLEYKK